MGFAGDGRTLVTASREAVALWDLSDRARVAPLTRLGGPAPTDLVVGGTRLVVGDASGEVHLWDLSDPANPRRLAQPWAVTRGPVAGLALGGDGSVLYTAGRADLFGSAVVAWDLGDRPAASASTVRRRRAGPPAVAATPDARLWASAGTGSVTLWTGEQPRPVATVAPDEGQPLSVALADEPACWPSAPTMAICTCGTSPTRRHRASSA